MTRKEIAEDFLKLAAKGHPHEAFRLHIAKNFKHHNAYFKGEGGQVNIGLGKGAALDMFNYYIKSFSEAKR